jgi:hypothetical protein
MLYLKQPGGADLGFRRVAAAAAAAGLWSARAGGCEIDPARAPGGFGRPWRRRRMAASRASSSTRPSRWAPCHPGSQCADASCGGVCFCVLSLAGWGGGITLLVARLLLAASWFREGLRSATGYGRWRSSFQRCLTLESACLDHACHATRGLWVMMILVPLLWLLAWFGRPRVGNHCCACFSGALSCLSCSLLCGRHEKNLRILPPSVSFDPFLFFLLGKGAAMHVAVLLMPIYWNFS